MKSNIDFDPKWASVPGNTIQSIIIEKQYSHSSLAEKMNVTADFLDQLIAGRQKITHEIAKGLSNNLGASISFWLQREEIYRSQIDQINNEQAEIWLQELPISDMISLGWIKNVNNKFEECLSFFDVPDISTWRRKYNFMYQNTSFRTSNTFKSSFGATAAWLRQGVILAETIACDKWDEDKFEESLSTIKKLTKKKSPKDFLPDLINICRNFGVAVVVSKTPKGCSASGATQFLRDDKVLLLLSLRYLSDDHFWFTFFHEVGHIILHKSKNPIIETDSNQNLSIEEEEANLYASEVLIPYDMKSELFKLRGNKRMIVGFAAKAGISPGIVVGQMQHHRIIDHKYLNSYKRRFSWDDINLLKLY
jgi:HTH-type transcriptional regulator / antitoxin HigA